jgi:glutamyl-tRNA synthetase
MFRIEDVTHSPAFFDLKKLAAFNGEYIRALPVAAFVTRCEPWLARWRDEHPSAVWDQAVFEAMAPLVQTRIVTLAEAPAMVDFLFLPEPEMDEASVAKALRSPSALAILADTITTLDTCEWTADAVKESFEKIAELHGQKLAKAQAPVRVAITGRTVGPPLFESLEHLGRDRTIERLRTAIESGRATAPA